MNQMKRKIIFLTLFTILAGVSLGETISEIQGDNMYSTMENKRVTKVEGVVTAVKKSKDNNGFFIQSRNLIKMTELLKEFILKTKPMLK